MGGQARRDLPAEEDRHSPVCGEEGLGTARWRKKHRVGVFSDHSSPEQLNRKKKEKVSDEEGFCYRRIPPKDRAGPNTPCEIAGPGAALPRYKVSPTLRCRQGRCLPVSVL